MLHWILQSDGPNVPAVSLAAARDKLRELAGGSSPGGMALADDEVDALFLASFELANGLGYFVNVRERGEIGEQVLVNPSLGNETVQGNIGGQGDTRPRFVFVDPELAERALVTFYETGKRDPELRWLPFQETT